MKTDLDFWNGMLRGNWIDQKLHLSEVVKMINELTELRANATTLRDQFAMHAPPMIGNGGKVRPRTPDECYKWADEMLAARKGTK